MIRSRCFRCFPAISRVDCDTMQALEDRPGGAVNTPGHGNGSEVPMQPKRNAGRPQVHGHARKGRSTPTYMTWSSMIARCFNSNATHYAYYGGRGITVCDRWLLFPNFLADMGERPDGLTLDRIDNNGNYEPGNCRWATWSQQMTNREWRRVLGAPEDAPAYERRFECAVCRRKWFTFGVRLDRCCPFCGSRRCAVETISEQKAAA